MKNNKIDYATIVSAQIWHNNKNNEFINDSIKSHNNLFQFFDFDSYWSDSYQKNNADERLKKICKSFNIIGITQYLGDDNAEWLISNEGKKLFEVISEKKLIVSFSCSSKHQKNIKIIADQYPDIPFLLHHMGGMNIKRNDNIEILKLSKNKNIYLKFSGYNYVLGEERRWDFPYNDAMWIYKEAYQNYGSRMVWGSDFPVVKFSSTYRQAFEVLNKYCDFISDNDKNLILGENLKVLLNERGKIV